jgi:hypothetical protein
MRLLLKLLVIVVIAVPLVVAWALYLAIDREPAIRRASEITPANIKRAQQVLEQNDPRKLRSGTRRSVTLNQQDLDVAANYLAHFYANGGARLILDDGKAEVAASLRPPQIPIIFYFNIMATLTAGSPLPRFAQLRVGQLSIPGFIADWLLNRAAVQLLGEDAIQATARSVKRIDLRERQLTIVYEWSSNLRESLRSAALSTDDQERLRAYQERLALLSAAPKSKQLSLAELLVALFELAQDRSRQGSAVAENRAAIIALAFYANGKSLGTILPAANDWPRPMPQTLTLNGRHDLAKHFIVSAALAAKVGGQLSEAMGVYKEIEDSRRGSGFSFNDIAADRAGTRFGEHAADTALAPKLQQRLVAGAGEKDIIPPTADLPEFLSEAEFKRRFGGVDAPKYKQMMTDIDRRIAALPLYR